MPLPETRPQSRPDPRFLDGIDGFLDAQLEHSANSASDNASALTVVVFGSEPWTKWECISTSYGHSVYLNPDLRLSPHRLVLTFADYREFAWSLHGITADGTVVLVMYRITDPPEPMAYVVGRPPWRRYNMNFAGCLRMAMLFLFSAVLLALIVGFLSTFF